MTDTHRALLIDKKLKPVAPHVLLSLLVITPPNHDVLPIVCTDYTYDSEYDIAEGVHLAFDAARVPGGEPTIFFYFTNQARLQLNLGRWGVKKHECVLICACQ